MKKDPRMSPLYVREWAKRQDADRDKIIESLRPPNKLRPGHSFQVQLDGSFLPLEPPDRVPNRHVHDQLTPVDEKFDDRKIPAKENRSVDQPGNP